MGHYERLLQQHTAPAAARRGITIETLVDGRPSRKTRTLGCSVSRLAGCPLPLARAVVRAREGRGAHLYHSLALDFPAPLGKPYVLTIHDLPPLRFSDEGSIPGWGPAAARGAIGIVTPSEFAKTEVVTLLDVEPDRVHVILNGCSRRLFNPDVRPASAEQLASVGLRGPFLTYAGGASRRKNVPALLAAWKQVADESPGWQLALAGPLEALRAHVEEAGAPRVQLLGYLPHDVLRGVVKASRALVVPSIYEGFGLPALEAMALGVPVVAVGTTAIPEVVGDAALLCRDGSPRALAGAIREVVEDTALRRALSQRGPERAALFTWEAHAAQLVQLYEAVLA